MKKTIVFTILLVYVSLFYMQPVLAYNIPATIRIGLQGQYRETDAITFENRTLRIGYEANGVFQQAAVITRSGRFSVTASYQHYVRTPQEVSGYEHARDLADVYAAQGYGAVPALVGVGQWTVYLGSYGSEAEAQNITREVGGGFAPANSRQIVLMDGERRVVVFDSASYFPQLTDGENGYVSLGDKKYRSVLEIGRYAGKKLTAVNVLPLEEYLYSAVSSEMPSAWSAEALKAQAVASRSYTVTRMGIHASDGYDLCEASHCQNYKGAANEAAATTQAVVETSGVMAYYGGQPINAVYFSSSGGMTEDSENCWPNAVPYLRSVADSGEYQPKEWTRRFSLAEITDLLNRNNVSIGSAIQVTIGYSSSGRVGSLTIQGTQGSRVLSKEEIRTFFSSSTGGSLESRNFSIGNGAAQTVGSQAYVTDGSGASAYDLKNLYGRSAEGAAQILQSFTVRGSGGTSQLSSAAAAVSSDGDGVTFVGKGWGHGVGMSQHGAEGLARSGYTYRQILMHYYTGVTIE